MARRVENAGLNVSDRKFVSVLEQAIELRTVPLELRSFVENFTELLLNDGDAVADADFAAQLFLNIRRGGKVVRVDMAFKDPFRRQSFFLDEINEPVREIRSRAARRIVEVQNGIDNRAHLRPGITRNV